MPALFPSSLLSSGPPASGLLPSGLLSSAMPMPGPAVWLSLSSALGLGLLIGLVRERAHADGPLAIAGLRTHALLALAGAVAALLGHGALPVALAAVAVLAALAYRATRADDPGLTGEVALLLTTLLGGLAVASPMLATALAVVVALLLYAKAPLHRFSRQLLTEREVSDGLMLLAAALVVLPALPDRGLGPFGAINPATVWKLVVLVMAVSALGHVCLRLVGSRWGLAVAGFFAGYVSSTAAVLGFGQRVRETPGLLRSAVAAALLANLASLSLCAPVLAAVSPAALAAVWPVLAAVGGVLLGGGLLGLRMGRGEQAAPPAAESRMFRFGQALGFALVVATLTLVTAALSAWIGTQGAMVAAVLTASVEVHAAVATLAGQFARGALDPAQARAWMTALLGAGLVVKSAMAWVSGGRAYGLRVAAGLMAALAAGIAATVALA